MNRILITIVLLVWLAVCGWSQTKTAYMQAAEKEYMESNFHAALSYYLEAYEFDSTDIEVNHAIAESARQFDAYNLAEKHYKKVIDLDAENKYGEDVFWYARSKQMLGNYQGAQLNYTLYATEYEGENEKLTARANKEIEASEWAGDLKNNPRPNVRIRRLGDGINTSYSEFAGIKEDEGLYFSSLRFEELEPDSKPNKLISKILLSSDDETADTLQVSLNEDNLFSAHTTYNKDKSKIYYTLCEYDLGANIRCDLFESTFSTTGEMSMPKKLNEQINPPGFTTTQPAYAYNSITGSERLYFSTNREGGKGGLDIWYVEISLAGDYSLPMSVPNINTPENEITPFYHADSRTLYFSSDGYMSMGGYDVYKSKEKQGVFGKPDHLGVPINSSYHDVYYSLDAEGENGYFSSNRYGANYIDMPQEACCYDIYKAAIADVNLNLNAKTFINPGMDSLVGATVKLYDAETGELIGEINNADGIDHNFELEPDREYMIIGEKMNYKPDTIMLSTKDMYTSEEITRNLFLTIDQICLDLSTFDKETQGGLDGATVTVRDLSDPTAEDIVITNPDSNRTIIKLDPNKSYQITIDKEGYDSETFVIDDNTTNDDGIIKRKIYMTKRDLNIFLPAYLYFDNDRPDRKTLRVTTDKTYTDTYNPYILRKPYFIQRVGQGKGNTVKSTEEQRMDDFFEFDVKGGYAKLYLFLNEVSEKLKSGYTFEIEIKGHTSPLAPSQYNKNLSQRRINSVRNELAKYNGGTLIPYMNANQLIIKDVSYGEDLAPSEINDRPSDLTESIFSVEASRERRVEIIKIRSTLK